MRLTSLLNEVLLLLPLVGGMCSCECCGVRPAEKWEQAVQCALFPDHAPECASECTDGEKTSDYARWCFGSCKPASRDTAAACVRIVDDDTTPLVAAVMPPPPADTSRGGETGELDRRLLEPAPVPRKAAPLREPQVLVKKAVSVSPTELELAKASMMQAKVHAKAAGAAARRAKESYELVLRSSREMAEYAGRMTYDEIQREAGEQSKKAMDIRAKYVKDAQDAAIKAAEGAAAPYKQGAKTAVKTAGLWNMRAGEFAASAGALKAQAEQMGKDAQTYTATQDYADAESFNRQAHQLVEQSKGMADSAASANNQANEIQGTLNWYSLAGRGAAATVLAMSMPYDVPPPALPNTVFLQRSEHTQRT